jgi:hypothetical protein
MSGNKAVADIESGEVEVESIDYPKLELHDGPGVNPANVGRKSPRNPNTSEPSANTSRPRGHHAGYKLFASATP